MYEIYEQFHFSQAYHNQTTLHPLGLVLLAIAAFAVCLVPRRLVMVPIFLFACSISPAQRIVIVDFDFTLFRTLLAITWLRVLIRGELRGFQIGRVDVALLTWVGFSALAYFMLYPNFASVVYQMGVGFDALATYFLVRVVFRDLRTLRTFASAAAMIAVPIAAVMTFERLTGYNMFAMFDGVPQQTVEREGRYRAQAAFAHPIIAGSFWAALLPVVLILARRDPESRVLSAVGVLGILTIIWCSSSSTPVLLAALVVPSAILFAFRFVLPWIRLGIVVTTVLLHIVMFAPVWHLFARINFFRGSTGWWRYIIIDRFVDNWDQWFLFGTTTSASWLPAWLGGGYVDVTNRYVSEGLEGGIIKLILFLAILLLCFRAVGTTIRSQERVAMSVKDPRGCNERMWIAWCLGISMLVHCAAYFATSYFGQLIFMQYLSFGLAAAAPQMLRGNARRVSAHQLAESPADASTRPAEAERPGHGGSMPMPVPLPPGLLGGAGGGSVFRPV